MSINDYIITDTSVSSPTTYVKTVNTSNWSFTTTTNISQAIGYTQDQAGTTADSLNNATSAGRFTPGTRTPH